MAGDHRRILDWHEPPCRPAWSLPGAFRWVSACILLAASPVQYLHASLLSALMLVEQCWRGSPNCPDCAEEVVQKEGTKLASRQEFAKRVAVDLFRFMESFNKGVQGDTLILPTNCLELWFQKFDNKFRRYSGAQH